MLSKHGRAISRIGLGIHGGRVASNSKALHTTGQLHHAIVRVLGISAIEGLLLRVLHALAGGRTSSNVRRVSRMEASCTTVHTRVHRLISVSGGGHVGVGRELAALSASHRACRNTS